MEELSNHLASITLQPSLSPTVHVILKEMYAGVSLNLRQSLDATLMPFVFHFMARLTNKLKMVKKKMSVGLKVACSRCPLILFS